MSSKLFTLLSPFLLSACAFIPVSNAQVPPGKVVPLGQWARITTPNEPGWNQMNIPNQFTIAKMYDSGATSVLINSVAFSTAETQAGSLRAILEAIVAKRSIVDEPNRHKILEAKNEVVQFKGFECLKFKTLSEDHLDKGIKSPDFLYMKTFGYVCPLNNKGVIQFEISERSKSKAINAAVQQVGNTMLESIEINPAFKPAVTK